MSRWDERHMSPFSMAWPSELWWPTTPETWDSVKTYGLCRLRTKMTRWDVMLHWETLASNRGQVESNDLAKFRGKSVVSQTIEHARANGVWSNKAWIPHKWCSVGEDKPRLRSDKATKPQRRAKNIYGTWIPLKASRERVKITTPHGWKSTTVTPNNVGSSH